MDPAAGWLLFALVLSALAGLLLWLRCGRLERENARLAGELAAMQAVMNGARQAPPRKRQTMWD